VLLGANTLTVGADNGSSELPRTMDLPLCQDCTHFLYHYPLPTWIKISAVALVVLAALVWGRNQRFLEAYREIMQSHRALQQGDYHLGAAKLAEAAKHAPECETLAIEADIYQGIYLLDTDQPAEAAEILRSVRARIPQDDTIDDLLIKAEAGAAFDRKDYDAFVTKSKEYLERYPDSPHALAMVASALACKYAVSGDNKTKQESLHYLDKAAQACQSDDPEFKDYEQRIRYRLATREIITSKEFDQRFPQGWKENSP